MDLKTCQNMVILLILSIMQCFFMASQRKQTFTYFLFSKTVRPETLKQMLLDCLTKLQNNGLIPKFVICDQNVNKLLCIIMRKNIYLVLHTF